MYMKEGIFHSDENGYSSSERQVEGDSVTGDTYCSRRKTAGTKRLLNPVANARVI